jgi:hypothetical protein
LSPEDALDASSRLIKYIFITRHAIPYLRQKEQ